MSVGSEKTREQLTDELDAVREERRACTERFRLAMDASGDGLFDWNLKDNTIYYSPGWKRILGYEPGEILNEFSEWERLTDSDDVARSWAMLKQLTERELDRFKMELRMRHKDGHWVDVLSRATAVFDENGVAVRVVGTHVDITKRKEVEKALAQSETRFRQVFDEAKDGMAVYEAVSGGADFVFKDVNAAGERIGNVKRSDVVGKSLREVRPNIDDFGLMGVLRRVWQTGEAESHAERYYEDEKLQGWFDNYVYRLSNGDIVALFVDNTDRRRAEEALRLKDMVFDSSISANSIADVGGHITEVNAAFLELWGFSEKHEVIGTPIADFFESPEGAATVLAELNTKGRWRGDFDAKRSDGTTFRASALATRLLNADGEVIGYQSSVLDVSEQRKSVDAMKTEGLLSQSYIDSLPGLFYVFDEQRFVRWNNAWAEITGYTDEELSGMYGTDFFEGEDSIAIGEAMLKVFRDGAVSIEADLVTKDGRAIPFFFTGLRRELNGKDYLIGLGINVSERKHAEAALAKSEEQYRTLAENIGIGVAMISPDMEILTLNRQMREWFPAIDASARPVCYRAFNDPPRENPCTYCPTIRTLQDGEIHEDTTETPTPDGTMHFRIVSTPVRDKDGAVTAAIEMVEDVTDRVVAESEKASLEDQLRQAQKMESIGRLAGGVAHDFNNLLTVIINYAEMIQGSLGPDDPLKKDASEIEKAGRRGAELTEHLLAFSRKQMITPKVMNLNSVIGGTEDMLKRLIGEDVELLFSLDDHLEMIDADEGQMHQILVNLVVNARDAMPEGGKLIVETSNTTLDEHYEASHPHTKPGRYVMLAVSDTGTGMSHETLANVFEPFFTTKPTGEGTGLGLATVYGIVKQGHGSIEVYSEPGRGTTFKVYLPVAERDEEESVAVRTSERPRGQETILLIEDEDSVRGVAKRILEAGGYRLLEAAHPGEALVIAKQHGGSIDLVLTDVIMPNMSGRECYRQLQDIVPGVKALFMSGYTAEVISHQGVIDDGTEFLQKPFSVEALARRVREVLDSPS